MAAVVEAGQTRVEQIEGMGQVEADGISNMFEAEQAARVKAVDEVGKLRIKEAKALAKIEQSSVRQMLEA
jgi:hypothetical protein